MASTSGRRVVVPLTNKSGGAVAAGDVVILDTSNNDAFTTTTSAAYTGTVGVAQEAIASNATGRVCLAGAVSLVNVNASVTRGHYGTTHTVAKQATDAGTARGTGTFCQFTTGGTTPAAILYPVDLLGTSLTNPMTTTGDLIYSSDNSGTPARLAAVASGKVLSSAGTGTAPAWAVLPGTLLGAVTYGSGGYSVTGTTMAALDTTNLRLTFTVPASGKVLARIVVLMQSSSTSFSFHTGILQSTTTVMDQATFQPAGTALTPVLSLGVSQYITGLTPGSATWDLAALNSVGSKTVTVYQGHLELWAG